MRVVKKLLVAIGILISLNNLTAQTSKTANIWYFGNKAGLDFSNGHPTVLTNGAMSAAEGTAVQSNSKSGELMFYTNGGDFPSTGAVWNRNHQVMPNGYLSGAGGCGSSVQSSLIVPKPGSESIFYLFTTDCVENSFSGGLSYSIIDMTLDGGLGDIVTKGISLAANTNESLAGVKHSNGLDYWIVAHIVDTDSFYAFHLGRNGIVGVVKSAIGPIGNTQSGEIKISSNGGKLYFGGYNFAALFDFDATTGVISNYLNMNSPGFTGCFSPNCQFLYIINTQNKRIYQYDMIAHDILASRVQVALSSSFITALQLGPDGRIYVAKPNTNKIGVINYPDYKGANCSYVDQQLALTGGTMCKYGMPNYTNDVLGECVPYPKENATSFDPDIYFRRSGQNELYVEVTEYNDPDVQYMIAYRKTGENHWETITSASHSIVISNLDADAEYEVAYRALLFSDHTYEIINNHRFEDVVQYQTTTGISDHSITAKTLSAFDFSMYPNPTKNKVSVELDLINESPVEVGIFNANGKVVYQQVLNASSGFNRFELPVNEIPNGVYNVSLKGEKVSSNKKLIIMK